MILNENPFARKATTLDDIYDKLKFAVYSSGNDDYVKNYDYYEECKALRSRLNYLRDRIVYDFFKNRKHNALYGIEKGDIQS